MHIKELVKGMRIRPLMYLQEEKIDYIYHFFIGYCGLARHYGDYTEDMDKHFVTWFVQWLNNWIIENYDKNYEFKTFHWNETIKEITQSEEEAVQLFYELCEQFFSDYEEKVGFFRWRL